MEIKDKWVVRETRDDLYFTGMNGDYPVLEPLNSRVRQYDSKRAAECAIRRIEESKIEYCEFRAEYIKFAEALDVSKEPEAPAMPEVSEVKDPSGWEPVFACAKPPIPGDPVKFAKISLCRKIIANKEIFGVIAADGKLYSAGIDGGENALKIFLEEYYRYLLPRVAKGRE